MRLISLAFLLSPSVICAQEATVYSYDALGRLISSQNTGGPRDNKAVLSSYDDVGNRRTHAVGVPAPNVSNNSTFSVSAPASAVTEGGVANFIVSRTGVASGSLNVSYSTVAGSAASSSDFAPATGTLTFRSWETMKSVSVLTVSDTVAELTETFSLQLSAPSGGSLIGVQSAVASIAGGSGGLPPATVSDALSVGICMAAIRNVVANDSDPGGSYPLTVIAVTSSPKGQAYVADASNIGFSAYGVTGSTQVTYTVRNSLGLTATGVLAVTITNGQGCN